jgi:hypothetical protein
MWAIFECFGYPDLLNQLDGQNIHRLENVIAMEPSMYTWFDKLWVWFEETVRFRPLRKFYSAHRRFAIERTQYIYYTL